MSSVDGYGVQKEGQKESRIQKEIETAGVERVKSLKKSLLKGLTTNVMIIRCGLIEKLLDVASEVCGYTKVKPRHFEGWWWNKDVDILL